MKTYHESDKVELIWLTKDFDYDMVTGLIPRYSKDQIKDLILEFDGYVEQNRCSGYIDLSTVTTDALAIVMDSRFGYNPKTDNVQKISYWKDYYGELWDVISSNEENMDDIVWNEAIDNTSRRAHLLLNIMVLGFSLHIPDDEREFLADHLAYIEDVHLYTDYDPWDKPYVQLVGDLIVLPCLVGERCEDESKRKVHSFYLDASHRRLPADVSRTQRVHRWVDEYRHTPYTRDLPKRTSRDSRRTY